MSPRVIYHVSNQREWIDAAVRMSDEFGWEPVTWFTTSANEGVVEELLPDCPRYDKFEAFRGVLPAWIDPENLAVIDGALMERLSADEWRYVRMLDRVDAHCSFSTAERMRTFRRVSRVCRSILDSVRPEAVVFSTCPHGPADLALYSICADAGVRTIIFTPTALPVYAYVRFSIADQPVGLVEQYKECLTSSETSGGAKVDESIAAYMSALRTDYDAAEPWYMQRQRAACETPPADKPTLRRLASALAHPERWRRYFQTARHRRHTRATGTGWQARTMKVAGTAYEESWMGSVEWEEYRSRANEVKRALRHEYDSLAVPFVTNATPYVYVPLHYQPERTTMPNGGLYDDQTLMVDVLAAALPEGWRLVVREHPSQFSDKLFGEQGRYPGYYRDLVQRENVVLVSHEGSPFGLLDNARAVATVTGTAGWEALARGVPVLCFGHAWYRGCEGVFDVASSSDVVEAMQSIVRGFQVRDVAVDAFAEAVTRYGARLSVNASEPKAIAPTYLENVESIVDCLSRLPKDVGIGSVQ